MQTLCVAVGALALSSAFSGGERWPTWPTEVDRVASPLREVVARPVPETERRRAVEDLEQFPTELIVDPIVGALDDPSAQVREAALEVCYRRRITACVSAAASLWSQSREPQLRGLALKVLALDPDPTRVVILLGALRDPNEQIRAQAAQYLGWSPLPPKSRAEARKALLAKLSDPASSVRLRVVETLGLYGPGGGTLALARLLEDPEPAVRAAAARALALHRDARAVPALVRALDGPNEAHVAAAILDALAQLPGTEVVEQLLTRLDDPPNGMQATQVADAIGVRPDPERELIEGLIARLREPALRRPVLRTLLLLGEPTRPFLIAASERGLEASLTLEVERLLDALEPTPSAQASPRIWPQAEDATGWIARLRAPEEAERYEAGRALAERAPAWLDPALSGILASTTAASTRRAWLVAAAMARRPIVLQPVARARLEAWAHDDALAPGDRCLAILVLGRTDNRLDRRRLDGMFEALAGHRLPEIRACTALARAHDARSGLLETLLLDADPLVRTAAALALATGVARRDDALSSRLAVMALEDPSAEARAAARLASMPLEDGEATRPPALVRVPRGELAWARPQRFVAVRRDDGQRLWIPAFAAGASRWGVLPSGAEVEVVADPPPG